MEIEFIIIGLMLAINALLASYEMAIASTTRARLTTLLNMKQKGAADALFMKERMEASLAVVQVGITFAAAVAAATGGAGVADWFEPYLRETRGIPPFWAEVISIFVLVIPLGLLTIIFAELIPKMVALNHRETICLKFSPVMKSIVIILYPLLSLLEKIVKQFIRLVNKIFVPKQSHPDPTGIHELNAAIGLARASRLISAGEEKILLSASQLSRKTLKQIMTPIQDICMISKDSTLTQALIQAHMDMHTRFPVYAGSPEKLEVILGYVNFKDIVNSLKVNPQEPSLNGILRPIQSYDENMIVSVVLENLIRDKSHLAMVVDSNRVPVGMITLEDIVEELIGDIEDEFDRQPNYIHESNTGWIMGGGVTMATVAEKTGIAEERKDLATSSMKLSEWCEKKAGRLKGGEMIKDGSLNVIIRKLRRQKVGEAVVMINKSEP